MVLMMIVIIYNLVYVDMVYMYAWYVHGCFALAFHGIGVYVLALITMSFWTLDVGALLLLPLSSLRFLASIARLLCMSS